MAITEITRQRFFLVVLSFLLPALCLAESNSEAALKPAGQKVQVAVRFLRASKACQTSPRLTPLVVEASLKDIAEKLEHLPFKNFQVLDAQNKIISVARRENIPLYGGYALDLRPLYVDQDRIGLWLRWTDSRGLRLVDTRMHITPDDTVVTGADGNGEEMGDVLAIKVSPAP